jgi:hypothetical protein
VINISISDVLVELTEPIEIVPSIVPLQPEVVEVVAIESDEFWLKAKFNETKLNNRKNILMVFI